MLNRYMPADVVLVADLSVCAPVFLEIPGKGFLFREELARTGAAFKYQIYGEIGLEHGPETFHGKNRKSSNILRWLPEQRRGEKKMTMDPKDMEGLQPRLRGFGKKYRQRRGSSVGRYYKQTHRI